MRSYYGYHRNIHTKNIRNYKKQLFVSKMDNIEGIDKFLERYNLLRLNQKEIENMNRPITSTEFESLIWKLTTNKSKGPDGFTGKFYQTFREELTFILLKLFQKLGHFFMMLSIVKKKNQCLHLQRVNYNKRHFLYLWKVFHVCF